MAIDKRLIPQTEFEIANTTAVEVDLSGEEAVDFELVGEEGTEDGGVVVDFDPEAAQQEGGEEHEANLAEFMDDKDLDSLGSELVQAFKDDKKSRADWEKAYIKGLSLLGLQIEERTQPWAGASGVFHPILTEAVIKFVAEAMMETFPASGPVLTKVVGKTTPEKTAQARRVQKDMNYQCIEVMPEYRAEHEQMLLNLSVAGSAFKKVYYDGQLERQTAPYIMADDFVVAYGTTNIRTCPRATHVMKTWPNDLLKKQHAGMYRDIDIPKPTAEYSDIEEKEDKVAGLTPTVERDDRHTLLEVHADLELPGYEDVDEDNDETGIMLPYIVTIDQSSAKVLSIYRNWTTSDPKKVKHEYFVDYKYLPGFGFYGIGMIHLLGGIAKSSTSILRQLVDAGTLSNLPAGLKARGLRIKGDDSPLRPGEFRDVDVPGGAIKDNITFVPYKEPSAVLYQLLGSIVEEGRNIASIADVKISEMDNQAPVGTTLAIMERGMKVMSSVHARIHASMRVEFNLLAELVKEHQPAEYEYDVEEGASRAQDYDERVDVLPISNPNASTMAQRIMTNQGLLQLSQSAPHIYDLKLLHRQMADAMGADNMDKIIPLDDEMKPMDPVAENMALITGEPIKAHIYQDHESHIRVHMAASQDPKIQAIISKSPAAPVIAAAGAAHIQEHVAFQYRREIEKQLGVPMPAYDENLPPEAEVQLSKLVADAADKVLQKDLAEVQAQKNAQQQNDPVLQLQRAEAETKMAEVKRKGLADRLRALLGMEQIKSKEKMYGMGQGMDMQKGKLDMLMEMEKLVTEKERIQSQEKQAGARMGVDVAQGIEDDKIERERIASQEKMATQRELVNTGRAAMQAESAHEQTEATIETAHVQASTNIATRFIDLLRQKEQSGQNENKNKENS